MTNIEKTLTAAVDYAATGIEKFKRVDSDKKIDIVLKTAVIAVASGILCSMTPLAPLSPVVAIGAGAGAFLYMANHCGIEYQVKGALQKLLKGL